MFSSFIFIFLFYQDLHQGQIRGRNNKNQYVILYGQNKE